MATPKSQRIMIWVITATMAIGSVGTYFLIVVQNDENQKAQQEQQKAYEELTKEAAKPKLALPGYSAEAFDPLAVTELKVETLVAGKGKAAAADSTVNANYFGWTSDGAIFDSSNKDGTITPIDFGLQGVITGWTEGLAGVKAGSTVKLTIPTDKAYGADAAAQGRPAGPLVFIIELKDVK